MLYYVLWCWEDPRGPSIKAQNIHVITKLAHLNSSGSHLFCWRHRIENFDECRCTFTHFASSHFIKALPSRGPLAPMSFCVSECGQGAKVPFRGVSFKGVKVWYVMLYVHSKIILEVNPLGVHSLPVTSYGCVYIPSRETKKALVGTTLLVWTDFSSLLVWTGLLFWIGLLGWTTLLVWTHLLDWSRVLFWTYLLDGTSLLVGQTFCLRLNLLVWTNLLDGTSLLVRTDFFLGLACWFGLGCWFGIACWLELACSLGQTF